MNKYINVGINFIVTTLLLTACSSSFVIVDRTGMTFQVQDIKLKDGKSIEILDGEAVRYIPIKSISKLVLDPSQTFFKDGKLYYHANILLTDGTQIKPRISSNDTTKSFVHIQNTILGKDENGDISIPLQDVNIFRKADLE
ncbi:MAG: hypothetical protein HQK83_13930 [Fibrobacteria bacterium]|nr:hypothetical protein [Fibrobacteria bacterium]